LGSHRTPWPGPRAGAVRPRRRGAPPGSAGGAGRGGRRRRRGDPRLPLPGGSGRVAGELRPGRAGAGPAGGPRRGGRPAEGDRLRGSRVVSGRRPGSGATGWLARLLNLVPYLQARPGVRIADAAADLGVTEQQLRDDLELLWVCGLPGYGPGDLIDMAFDGDRVTITYDAGMDRPLRLTPDEALALVVALRMLAETPGVADRGAIDRALAKLEAAAGQPAPVAVRMPGDTDKLTRVREAVDT